MKEPSSPYEIKQVRTWNVSYTQKQMAGYYPDQFAEKRKSFVKQSQKTDQHSEDLWSAIYNLDCMMALSRLSGTNHVRGESYHFQQNANGNYNILVDGRSTSCFLDASLRIGSLDHGGPTVFQWLKWFGHSGSEALRIIRDVIPEVESARQKI